MKSYGSSETIDNAGRVLYDFASQLFPINRSLTGEGVRETLKEISKIVPLTIHSIPTGTKVFDWEIPQEWNITDAYVKNSKGERVIDFGESNLHVVSYSTPIRKSMSLAELKPHLFTDAKNPKVIPFKTSYYDRAWGFCLTHEEFLQLKDDTYEVCIDSSLTNGELTYGELLIKGKTEDEILISTHVCHPSLANDNLSGIAVATFLAKTLLAKKLRYSYRFLFIPATIGAIAWLSKNEKRVENIKGGFVLSGVGDSGKIHYKKSRQGDGITDKAFAYVLTQKKAEHEILEFSPFGYDERQYCSPGFNLPVGCFMRSVFSSYPEYHTSGDNLDFIKPEALEDSFVTCLSAINFIENERVYINLYPKCEPQLGKRGLYKAMNNQTEDVKTMQLAMLWVLNLSDGTNSLQRICEKSQIAYGILEKAAALLVEHDLLIERK